MQILGAGKWKPFPRRNRGFGSKKCGNGELGFRPLGAEFHREAVQHRSRRGGRKYAEMAIPHALVVPHYGFAGVRSLTNRSVFQKK